MRAVQKDFITMQQRMAPLPADRVQLAHPFQIVGLDFAGPIYLRAGKGITKKGYICLFTCAVTRAVHLELCSDMSVKSFWMVKRFVATRGRCLTVYSDNAKTFECASKELEKLWKIFRLDINSQEIKAYCIIKEIKGKFIAQRALVRRHVQKICENQHTRPKFEDNYQFYSYTGAGTVLPLTASPSDVTMGGG